jgi:hypothetical protein
MLRNETDDECFLAWNMGALSLNGTFVIVGGPRFDTLARHTSAQWAYAYAVKHIMWVQQLSRLTSTSPLLVRLLYNSDGESVTNTGGAA